MTAIALVACRAAAADSGADPSAAAEPGAAIAIAPHGDPPAGWRALPAIGAAVANAMRSDGAATSIAVDAWGTPAAGCYAVWLALQGAAGDAPALADRVLGGLSELPIGDLVKPTGAAGLLSFAFARPPYRGRLRARLGLGRIAAVACFGNAREPAACDTSCARVLEDMR